MGTYRVFLTPAADRQFTKLRQPARAMVAAAIGALGSNPHPPGCVKLAGTDDLWRVRVRDHRVLYQILDDRLIVTVVKIGDRRDVYR